MSYTQLISSDANGLTVAQLIQALKLLPQHVLVTDKHGQIVNKVAKTIDGEQVFIQIYDEME